MRILDARGSESAKSSVRRCAHDWNQLINPLFRSAPPPFQRHVASAEGADMAKCFGPLSSVFVDKVINRETIGGRVVPTSENQVDRRNMKQDDDDESIHT